jgi:hypothetical protein
VLLVHLEDGRRERLGEARRAVELAPAPYPKQMLSNVYRRTQKEKKTSSVLQIAVNLFIMITTISEIYLNPLYIL